MAQGSRCGVGSVKRHSGSASVDSKGTGAKSAFDEELATLCEQLHELRANAESLGLFANEREVVSGPTCGLQEDVSIEGFLITHDIRSLDVQDSGLRFNELKNGQLACPRCGAHVVE